MAVNHLFKIRAMQSSDLDQALRLSVSEGWNQTEKDWKLLLDNPENVCIVAEKDGRIVGTATALNHSGRVAWIGMVLVDKELRGMGAGRMLMSDIAEKLKDVVSIKLDATPAGLPLYKSLGFVEEYAIHRMTSPLLKMNALSYPGEKPEVIKKEKLTSIVEKDASIFGAERSYLLRELFSNYPRKAFSYNENKSLWGYAFGRDGMKYNYIGPVCAVNTEAATGLIVSALQSDQAKPFAVDVPADKKDLIKWLESTGFTIQRDFTRMYLGKNPYPGKTEFQYLISGPEFG
jgi:GNAT superfamily N-acetyltransferase